MASHSLTTVTSGAKWQIIWGTSKGTEQVKLYIIEEKAQLQLENHWHRPQICGGTLCQLSKRRGTHGICIRSMNLLQPKTISGKASADHLNSFFCIQESSLRHMGRSKIRTSVSNQISAGIIQRHPNEEQKSAHEWRSLANMDRWLASGKMHIES